MSFSPNFRTLTPSLFAVTFAAVMVSGGLAVAQTRTSTAPAMPEDGGPLPRANMPMGGVEDGMPRAVPPVGGVHDDGLPRAKMPGDGVVEPYGLPDVSDDDDDDDEDCHSHGEGGQATEHCHEHAKGPHSHRGAADEHCHLHQHDGEPEHAHCHEHAKGKEEVHDHSHVAAGPTAKGEVVCHDHIDADGASVTHCHPSTGRHAHGKEAMGIEVSWDGYLRVVAEVIENDERSEFIGRNDGFKLANARLGMRAKWQALLAYISIEAAVGDREAFNDPNAEFAVMPRDAFLSYHVSSYADVTAGRFRTPYDLGALESTATRTFIDAPLESRGVLPAQGLQVDGMTQDRQLGLMVHRRRIGLSGDGIDFGYAIALTNGRTLNLALNDNDRPAAFGRISAYYGPWIELNVAGFTDGRTRGELPNLFDEDVKGTEASMVFAWEGVRIEGQVLFQNTQFDTSGRPDVNALGAHAQGAYKLFDALTVAYRFAYYDPNTRDTDDADAVVEHTLGVGYDPAGLPMRFLLNGTVAAEQSGRNVSNNRLALLGQFTF